MEEQSDSSSASGDDSKKVFRQKLKEISKDLEKMVNELSMVPKQCEEFYYKSAIEELEDFKKKMANVTDNLQNCSEEHGSKSWQPMEHTDLIRSSPVVTGRNDAPIRRIDRSASDTTGGSIKVVIEITPGRARHSYPCQMCTFHHGDILPENSQNLDEVQIAVQHTEAQENDDTQMETISSQLKHKQV